MKTVSVTFNEQSIDVPFFRWGLMGGTRPYTGTFMLTNAAADTFLNASKDRPVTLVCDNEHVEPAVAPWKFSDLYITRTRRLDEWHVEVTLADNRSRFDDLRFTGFFNISRQVNDVVTADDTIPRNTDARTAFRSTDFLPHTLKNGFASIFHKPTRFFYESVPDVGVPWTAFTAVEYLLTRWLPSQDSSAPAVVFEATDNGRQLNNVYYEETRFFTCLSQLLALAQVNLYVDTEGKWVVYDVHAAPFPAGLPVPGGVEGAGVVEPSVYKYTVPKNLRIKFPKAFDYHVFYEETGDATDAVSDLDALQQLENVLPLPDSVGDYERGEWVTINEALSLWNADGWANGSTLTLEDLRRKFYSKRAVRSLCMADRLHPVPKLATRLSVLKSHFRQVFRLPPFLLGFLREWDVTLTATADPITGTRVSSPVWQDFAYIANTRAGGPEDTEMLVGNVPHPFRVTANSVAVFRDDLWDLEQAPAKLRMIDATIGVFRVVFDESELGSDKKMYLTAEFSTVEEEKTYGDSVFIGRSNLETVTWNEKFRLDTVIMVVPMTPDMYLEKTVDMSSVAPSSLGQTEYTATAPKFYDYVARDVEAKYQWLFGTTGVEINDGGFSITRPLLANLRMVEAVAEATAKQLIPTFADRIEGVFRSHQYIPQRDRPLGNKYLVEFHMDAKSVVEIVTTFLPVASARDRYEFLPDDVRRKVYREVRKGK